MIFFKILLCKNVVGTFKKIKMVNHICTRSAGKEKMKEQIKHLNKFKKNLQI